MPPMLIASYTCLCSTITLTMDRYAHTGLHDVAPAVAPPPALPMNAPEMAPQTMKAAGTDGPGLQAVCTGFVQTNDSDRSRVIGRETADSSGDDGEMASTGHHSPLVIQPFATGRDCVTPSQSSGGAGFEPANGLPRCRFSSPQRRSAGSE